MMSGMWQLSADSSVFFFNDTATTEIYTLSLHDALPISAVILAGAAGAWVGDNASYVTGRRLGRPLTRRFFKRPRAQRRLTWARDQLDRRGWYLVVVARFIPGGRTAVTFTAGLVRSGERRVGEEGWL